MPNPPPPLPSPDYAAIQRLLTVPLPLWMPVRQVFERPVETDVAAAVRRELARPEIRHYINPGQRVALAVGSRGIHNLAAILAAAVQALKEAGCQPFIVPAMGSHGGATAEGQQALLAHYGVTPQAVGAEIRSSMDVIEIGQLGGGLLVYFDRLALEADLVIPVNRIKPHTSFHAPLESGLAKMLTVGLGKHAGALALHSAGFPCLGGFIRAALSIVQQRTPFGFGLALLENAYQETAHIEAVPGEALPVREPELLALARQWMGRLQFETLDVLVVGQIGKDISGTGMDPNVTGRSPTGLPGKPQVNKIVALDLTPGSEGNAVGLGMADITTQRLIGKVDLASTWINALTSTVLHNARLPLFMPDERRAIQLALQTCNQLDPARARAAIIRDTLQVESLLLSQALWDEVRGDPRFTPLGQLRPLPCDAHANLAWDWL